MALEITARVLIDGAAEGPVLRLAEPLSFWGGVDPVSGRIVQPAHPDCGADLAGTVLALPGLIGSSSSSAVLLELIRAGCAPAAVVMAEVDAILALGAAAAEELGLAAPPVLHAAVDDFVTGQRAAVRPGGHIHLGDAA
ncbi:MAG: DUF126 domain-containing protein [Rhodospirillaceae bacterium]